MSTKPRTIPIVSGSPRNATPSASATAGLTYVMTVARAHVQPDERGDAEEAGSEAGDATQIDTLVGAGGPGEDRADRRDQRDEESGKRARDASLGIGQEEPRRGDLDERIRDDPLPVTKQWPQIFSGEGDGQEQSRADRGAKEDETRRRELAHRDLDEEVRNSPDHAHRREQNPAPSCHRVTLTRRCQCCPRYKALIATCTSAARRAAIRRSR